MNDADIRIEVVLLGLLALLWGSSYLFIKIAVAEIPPATLIAARVVGAAIFLMIMIKFREENLPCDSRSWRMLLVQAFFNSIGAWTVLAWGQKYVSAGLASVLNSTSYLHHSVYSLFDSPKRPRNTKTHRSGPWHMRRCHDR